MFFIGFCEDCKKERTVTAYNYKFLCNDCRGKEYIRIEREMYEDILFYRGKDKKLEKTKKKIWDEIYLQNNILTIKKDFQDICESIPKFFLTILIKLLRKINKKY